MKPSSRARVVDASVAAKLFVPEEYSDRAQRLFSLLESDNPIILFVPDLLYLECANLFRSRTKMRVMSAAEAKKASEILHALPLESLAIREFSAQALDLSIQYDLSAYDACYLAVSVHLKLPLITADKKFARKLSGSAHRVIWIGEWKE